MPHELIHQEEGRGADALPLDMDGPNTLGSAAVHETSLSREETRQLIHETSRAYHTRTSDLLATALATAVGDWTGSREIVVDLEAENDGERSRYRSWAETGLPHGLPVRIQIPQNGAWGDKLMLVKEQLRAPLRRPVSCWNNGSIGTAEVRLRPADGFEQLFMSSPVVGLLKPPLRLDVEGPRSHVLEVEWGQNPASELSFRLIFSRNLHKPSTIARLAENFVTNLRRLIEHCVKADVTRYTPSDFPGVELDEERLRSILDQVKTAD